jgi:hypothetical protein
MNAIVKHRQPHTPGPWTTKWVNNSVYIKAVDADRDVSVCRVMSHRTQNNLNVLLAAPDMLKALETIALAANAGDPDSLANAINESIEIICKAKGC